MQRVGLIGHPLTHSRSPILFRAAFAALGLEHEYTLEDIPDEGGLPDFLARARRDWRGFNVTLPHKVAIAELLDQRDRLVEEVGAVNCVVNERGLLRGFNTDVPGLHAALRSYGTCYDRSVVLGAGGAARAAIVALKHAGAGEVTVVARSHAALANLRKDFPDIVAVPWEDLSSVLSQATAVINATSAGVASQGHDYVESFPWEVVRAAASMIDLNYARGTTLWCRRANALGFQNWDGREMLLQQAAEAFSIWFGETPPVAAMRLALLEDIDVAV